MPLDNADFGLAVDRPTASAVNKGRIFVSTDTGDVEISDGSVWVAVSSDLSGYATEQYVDDADDVVRAAALGVHLPPIVIPGVEYMPTVTAVSANPASPGAANSLWAIPFIPRVDFDLDQIAVRVGQVAATGTFRIVAYEDDGTLNPGDIIGSSGVLSAAALGDQSWATNISVAAGEIIWIGMHVGVVSTTMLEQVAASSFMGIRGYTTAAPNNIYAHRVDATVSPAFGGGAPAVFPANTPSANNTTLLRLRAA